MNKINIVLDININKEDSNKNKCASKELIREMLESLIIENQSLKIRNHQLEMQHNTNKEELEFININIEAARQLGWSSKHILDDTHLRIKNMLGRYKNEQ